MCKGTHAHTRIHTHTHTYTHHTHTHTHTHRNIYIWYLVFWPVELAASHLILGVSCNTDLNKVWNYLKTTTKKMSKNPTPYLANSASLIPGAGPKQIKSS